MAAETRLSRFLLEEIGRAISDGNILIVFPFDIFGCNAILLLKGKRRGAWGLLDPLDGTEIRRKLVRLLPASLDQQAFDRGDTLKLGSKSDRQFIEGKPGDGKFAGAHIHRRQPALHPPGSNRD